MDKRDNYERNIQAKAAAIALAGTNLQAIEAVCKDLSRSEELDLWAAVSECFGASVDANEIHRDMNMPFLYRAVAGDWLLAKPIANPNATVNLWGGQRHMTYGFGTPEGTVRGSLGDMYLDLSDGKQWVKGGLNPYQELIGWVQYGQI